uniref:autotransporter outer membrane beta-barrel domain-containing protein n=1 Tax=Castellaniella defragrans TaxID=75697 RepID=UPI00333F33A0
MKHIHKTILNKKTGTCVAVSEIANGRRRSSGAAVATACLVMIAMANTAKGEPNPLPNIEETGDVDISGNSADIGIKGAGALLIEKSAAMTLSGHLHAGREATGEGLVTVREDSSLSAGWAYIGTAGKGVLDINETSTMSVERLYAGSQADAHGRVVIDGKGSQLEVSSETHIGNAGKGELSIMNGATMSNVQTFVGEQATGAGTITVKGEGSLFSSTSTTYIGTKGTGKLDISEGGKMLSEKSGLSIGAEEGGNGTVTVSDEGSSIEIASATVGSRGEGQLNILAGATVVLARDHLVAGYEATGKGVVTVSGKGSAGEASSLSVTGNTEIGKRGKDNILYVKNGAEMLSGSLTAGTYQNSEGTVIIKDASLIIKANSTIGVGGAGELRIQQDARMSTNNLYAGTYEADHSDATGDGTIIVSGNGAFLKVANYSRIGVNGAGALVIDDHAAMETQYLTAGHGADSEGGIAVSGAGSSLIVEDDTHIGRQSKGTLFVDQGAAMTTNSLMAGSDVNGNGIITISGAGTKVTVNNNARIGNNQGGTGVLNIQDRGEISVANIFTLASPAGSTGTLNIGTGGLAGTLMTASVTGGQGTAIVNFNHIDDIEFTPKLTGSLAVNHLNRGVTALMGAGDYTGNTTIAAGIFQAGGIDVFSANSRHFVNGGAMFDLNGFSQTTGALTNAGQVRFGTVPGTILTVKGDYTGDGGVLAFNTDFEADDSATDKMVVQGNTSGAATAYVIKAGGGGALTTEGIQLVAVNGISDGTFTLQSEHGVDYVVAGAYTYRLYQGNASGSETKGWYLRSELTPKNPNPFPEYHVGSPAYEAYPQVLLSLNHVDTFRQRMDARLWAHDGDMGAGRGRESIPLSVVSGQGGGLAKDYGLWGRIEGARNHIQPRTSTIGADFDLDVAKIQLGVDRQLGKGENGTLIGGVFAHYLHGDAKANPVSPYASGDISTEGYGLGGTLTWYGENGFYVDGLVQTTWYRSDLSTRAPHAPKLVDGNTGFGYALSIEAGKSIAINPEWSITPQAQLVYSRVDFDTFDDGFGSRVRLDQGDSLRGRLGVMLDRGLSEHAHVYGIASAHYEFRKGTRISIADVSFESRQDPLWGSVGLGGSYGWNKGKFSLYGEGLYGTSLSHIGGSHSIMANVGLRIRW